MSAVAWEWSRTALQRQVRCWLLSGRRRCSGSGRV